MRFDIPKRCQITNIIKIVKTQRTGVLFDAEYEYRTFGDQISRRGHVTPQKGVKLEI